jgi:hypothetical protein
LLSAYLYIRPPNVIIFSAVHILPKQSRRFVLPRSYPLMFSYMLWNNWKPEATLVNAREKQAT